MEQTKLFIRLPEIRALIAQLGLTGDVASLIACDPEFPPAVRLFEGSRRLWSREAIDLYIDRKKQRLGLKNQNTADHFTTEHA
jgi:predicted DNA-binding transcriptional regulator AlpA